MKTIETVIAERQMRAYRYDYEAELAALACAVAGLRKAKSYRDPSTMIDECLKEIARLMGIDAEDAK